MVNKKIYISKLDYEEVSHQLLKKHDKFEKRTNSTCLYFPNGVTIRIFALLNCTKITVTRRLDRNNKHHFVNAIEFLERALNQKVFLKSYGEF